MTGRPKKKTLEAACAKWDAAHPVGTKVNYWPGVRDDTTAPRTSVTWTEAQIMGSHTAGVYLRPGGFVALSHVQAIIEEVREADHG